MAPINKKKTSDKKLVGTADKSSVKDYGKDPVFVKRAAEWKAFLEKVGFPKELADKK